MIPACACLRSIKTRNNDLSGFIVQLEEVLSMAVPKRRVSKTRRDKRRTHWKLSAPGLSRCPKCHEVKMPHRVCAACGFYNGKAIVK